MGTFETHCTVALAVLMGFPWDLWDPWNSRYRFISSQNLTVEEWPSQSVIGWEIRYMRDKLNLCNFTGETKQQSVSTGTVQAEMR